MNRKDFFIASGFIIGLIASLGLGFLILFLNAPDSEDDPPYYNIHVYSDAKFVEYGFPGNGSKENPYRIENYTLSNALLDGIRIDNVTKHFVIRNNEISAERNGIFVYLVAANITRIENNIIHGCEAGIVVYYAQGGYIFNNMLYDNFYHDIAIMSFINTYGSYNSYYSIIANNTCYRDQGMAIRNSRNRGVLFENNSIFFTKASPFGVAMELYSPINNTVRNNYFENCGFDIYFDDYSDWDSLKLIDNFLNGKLFNYMVFINRQGLSINCSANEYHQINMVNCMNIELFGGTFSLTNKGLSLTDCSNIEIKGCYFTEMGSVGADLSSTWNVSFIDTFFSDSYEGLKAYYSHDLLILNCSFANCGTGVKFIGSNAFLRNSTIKGNLYGCYLVSCGNTDHINYNCTITSNVFFNNSIGCIALETVCVLRDNKFLLNYNGLYMIGGDSIPGIYITKCQVINNQFIESYMCVKMKLSESHFIDNYFGYSDYGIYYSSDSLFWLSGNSFEFVDVKFLQAPSHIIFPVP